MHILLLFLHVCGLEKTFNRYELGVHFHVLVFAALLGRGGADVSADARVLPAWLRFEHVAKDAKGS